MIAWEYQIRDSPSHINQSIEGGGALEGVGVMMASDYEGGATPMPQLQADTNIMIMADDSCAKVMMKTSNDGG
jgi:hypothetical protein